MSISSKIKSEIVIDLESAKEEILEEFRKRTPGYGGEHVIAEEGSEHEHSGNYIYTHGLETGWKFSIATGMKTVGAVYNAMPYAALVENGYIRKDGTHMHGGGHRIIESTLRHSGVRAMYAAMANKALIVALAAYDYKQGKALVGSQVAMKAVGARKDGMSVYFKMGKTIVKGHGSGVQSESLRRAAYKFGEALAAAMNAGIR